MPVAVPVQAYITPFSEGGQAEASVWSEPDVHAAIRVANRIWAVAGIHLSLRTCILDAALDIRHDARMNGERLLNVLSYRHPAGGSVNVFFINSVAGLTAGGLSYLNSEPEAACYVQYYSAEQANGRVVAHELGHLLSLDHVLIDFRAERRAARLLNNLMREGLGVGTELDSAQIRNAQGSRLARRFGGGRPG
jgi:hypothetical protein